MVLKNQLNMGEEMKRLLGVALAVGLLTSCSVNYSPTDIAFDQTLSGSATGEMQTDAQGLTTANTPTQDASGSAAADGGLASLGGIRDAVGKLVPDMSQKTTTATTTTEIKEEVKPVEPVPVAPVFPDVTPPATPAEEIAEPEGQIEEVD